MKRILLTLSGLLLFTLQLSAAVHYLGACVNSDGTLSCSPSADLNGSFTTAFNTFTVTADQSGDWTELSCYCQYQFGTQAHFRVAVYRASDGRLEAQGSSYQTVISQATWQGHIGAGFITQYHAAVSGTAYKLGLSVDGNAMSEYFDPAGSSGDNLYDDPVTGYAASGWPDPLPTLSTSGNRTMIRAAITPSGGGGGGGGGVFGIISRFKVRH